MENKFSVKLIRLAEYDLSVREKLMEQNRLEKGYHPEMEKVHRKNAGELRNIISEIGFPTISKVGREASNAAWLIIQHSIGEPEFMKNSYNLMLESADDLEARNLAYLLDRILFFQGKPQKYGTQLNADGTIYPVIRKTKLNELRLKHYLPALSGEDIDKIPPSEAIERLENENPDYIEWRKKTGWK
nr:DUF6624 domain-containing protein [uncultured Chryseobacterium sp.]